MMIRSRYTQNHPSVGSSRSSKYSFVSRKSRYSRGPKMSASSGTGPPSSKWLKPREYVLLLIEATLTFTSYIVKQRLLSEQTKTSRNPRLFALYVKGYSSVVCMFFGCMADTYLTHYVYALCTVILHFTVLCMIVIENTFKINLPEFAFSGSLTMVCFLARMLFKASDFTRLVYALEGLAHRTKSTINVFIFLHFWVSSSAVEGGLVVSLFAGACNYFEISISKLPVFALVLNGLSLFLFVYALDHDENAKEQYGLGCKVVGCLILAVYYKIFGIKNRPKKGFFGNVEGPCGKTTVLRTRDLVKLYAVLVPAIGLVCLTFVPTDLFYRPILEKLKSDKITRAIGLKQLAGMISSFGMIVSYFIFWPVLRKLGFKDKDIAKFLIGNFLLVLSSFHVTIVMKFSETLEYPTSTGFIRFHNTRESPVFFRPMDRTFSTHDFEVPPNSGMVLTYPSYSCQLTPMMAEFKGTKTNFTSFLSVCPYESTGYVILDPPEIVRIRGVIPWRDPVPRSEKEVFAMVYIYCTAPTLYDTELLIRREKKILKEMKIPRGRLTTISLQPAEYEFFVFQAEIHMSVLLEEGGLYGLLIYDNLSAREAAVDVVREPNKMSTWPFIFFFFWVGVASSFAYPSLRAIIYDHAPEGLMAMSFAFLAFLEGIPSWVYYVGFITWHKFMTARIVLMYSCFGATFFFLSFFVSLKYRSYY